MYDIGQKIQITTHSQMFDLQSAFANAKLDALNKFDHTSEGHMNNVTDFRRSSDSMVLELDKIQQEDSMLGFWYTYTFSAYIKRHD